MEFTFWLAFSSSNTLVVKEVLQSYRFACSVEPWALALFHFAIWDQSQLNSSDCTELYPWGPWGQQVIIES